MTTSSWFNREVGKLTKGGAFPRAVALAIANAIADLEASAPDLPTGEVCEELIDLLQARVDSGSWPSSMGRKPARRTDKSFYPKG